MTLANTAEGRSTFPRDMKSIKFGFELPNKITFIMLALVYNTFCSQYKPILAVIECAVAIQNGLLHYHAYNHILEHLCTHNSDYFCTIRM